MVTVKLSKILSESIGATEKTILCQSEDLFSVIHEANQTCKGLIDRIMLSPEEVKPFIAISINGQLQPRTNLCSVLLNDKDTVYIMNLIAGG